MMTLPDETTAQIFTDDIEPNLQPGNYLAVAHGFNIRMFWRARRPRGPPGAILQRSSSTEL